MLDASSRDSFLTNIWRKRCHVFPSAVDTDQYRLTAEDICSITSNENVESRLIGNDYQLTLGPFENSNDGDELLPDKSMLLVHSLENYFPVISQLLISEFNFLPRWQVDDVMASVGNADATCGAHFDRYDVFLLQLKGSKHWQLDNASHDDGELRDDVDIRLLHEFEPEFEVVLNPGDVLYVPPGAGHYGTCRGDSITLSIGIRNPSLAELLADISEEALLSSSLDVAQTIEQSLHTTTMIDAGIEDIKQALLSSLDDDLLTNWYGRFVTRLREPDLVETSDSSEINVGDTIELYPYTRVSLSRSGSGLKLFTNGDLIELSAQFESAVSELCTTRQLLIGTTCPLELKQCLGELLESGAAFIA